MRYRLELDYSLPQGRLSPYFEALAEGQALAERCDGCGRAQFPPGGVCGECGGSAMSWVRLPGTAVVVHRTDTPEAAFALVRFDGADNAALVRITDPGVHSERGALVRPPEEAPGILVTLVDTKEE